MSFVMSSIALMQATAQRSDASFAIQNNNQVRMGLANKPAMDVAMMGDAAYQPGADGKIPIQELYLQDRALTLKNIQTQVQMAAAAAIEESYQKRIQQDIKRDFRTFNSQA